MRDRGAGGVSRQPLIPPASRCEVGTPFLHNEVNTAEPDAVPRESLCRGETLRLLTSELSTAGASVGGTGRMGSLSSRSRIQSQGDRAEGHGPVEVGISPVDTRQGHRGEPDSQEVWETETVIVVLWGLEGRKSRREGADFKREDTSPFLTAVSAPRRISSPPISRSATLPWLLQNIRGLPAPGLCFCRLCSRGSR